MRTSRGFERLNAFADAVVAIAMTLLVLPLVDIPAGYHGDLGALLAAHFSQLFAFVLSFAVIAKLWAAHHKITEHLDSYRHGVLTWTMIWLLTIVFMPFPTELLGHGPVTQATAALYIATLLGSSVSLAALAWLGGHRADLRNPEAAEEEVTRLSSEAWAVPAAIAAALVLALGVPPAGVYGLLLLLLEPWLARLARRRPFPSLLIPVRLKAARTSTGDRSEMTRRPQLRPAGVPPLTASPTPRAPVPPGAGGSPRGRTAAGGRR